jgi:hypothetical protein
MSEAMLFIPTEEMPGRNWACIWEGCTATCSGIASVRPSGWANILLYHGQPNLSATLRDVALGRHGRCPIDAVLCPEHVRALFDLMKLPAPELVDLMGGRHNADRRDGQGVPVAPRRSDLLAVCRKLLGAGAALRRRPGDRVSAGQPVRP